MYFNSANLSKCPEEVLRAIHQHQIAFEDDPTQGLKEAWNRLWSVQCSLARFLNCDPNSLILRSNVTSAFNNFLLGLSIPKDSEILVGEHEYGSIVNICRLKALREGLTLRILSMPSGPVAFGRLSRNQLIDSILGQISPRTGLLLLSHVIGGTGLVIPVAELSRALEDRPLLFAVDASYAVGALPIDIDALGRVDFYGSSLYKYMKGPKGTAFARIHPRAITKLSSSEAGWPTFGAPPSPFGAANRFATEMALKGCHDFSPFFAIEELLSWWRQRDPEAIRSRIFELNQYVVDRIEKRLGWRVLRSGDASLRGPFSAFLLPDGIKATSLVEELWVQHSIQVHGMEIGSSSYVVISPHCDNSEEEVNRLVDVLEVRALADPTA